MSVRIIVECGSYLVVLFPVLGEHGLGPEDLTAVRTAPPSDPAPAPRTTLTRLRRWWFQRGTCETKEGDKKQRFGSGSRKEIRI
jgi:hypothetical protein